MSDFSSPSQKWRSIVDEVCKIQSPKWLSERLGVSLNTVYSWRNHGTLPDVESLLRYCEVLGVSVTDIVCGEQPAQPKAAPQKVDVMAEALKLPASERKKLVIELVASI